MSEAEVPPELRSLLEAERAAPRVDANARAALRTRLAASVANWDGSATSDLDTKQLEERLAPLVEDAPLDELRSAKGRRGELVHATAQEPVAVPPAGGRVKGKMNIFDKRIIGGVALTAAAIGLLGVTAYKRHVDAPATQLKPDLSYGLGPLVNLGRSFVMTPNGLPVAPTTGADLAITAGESAWIHVPFGAVDIEIQSKCNAEVEMFVPTGLLMQPGAHPGAPPTVSTESNGEIIVGKDSPDGRASTYHLTPGRDPSDGMYAYTSRCVGQPPIRGNLVVDRVDVSEPIGPMTNARVLTNQLTDRAIRVFGTVLPGARVSIGAKLLALEPAEPTNDDLPIYSKFAAEVPISLDHLVAAVRVDDVNGTHFYAMQASPLVRVMSCATTMTAPKQTAEKLDAQGDHAGALKALETAMAACKPDRDTLSLALSYACQAGNAEAAKNYWRRLPPELQRSLEPVCARNQITRDALDR